jgi:hypothetical protein
VWSFRGCCSLLSKKEKQKKKKKTREAVSLTILEREQFAYLWCTKSVSAVLEIDLRSSLPVQARTPVTQVSSACAFHLRQVCNGVISHGTAIQSKASIFNAQLKTSQAPVRTNKHGRHTAAATDPLFKPSEDLHAENEKETDHHFYWHEN